MDDAVTADITTPPAPAAVVVSTPQTASAPSTLPPTSTTEPAPASPVEATPSPETPPADTTVAGAASSEIPVTEQSASVDATAKPEEAPLPVEATPPAPVAYTDFTMPEGVTVEGPQLSAYKNILGKFALPQEAGQELLEFGAQSIKDAIKAEGQRQHDVFAKQQSEWTKQVDKEFGNRRDTVIQDANWVLANFGGTKEQRTKLNHDLAMTGAGNNPNFIRLLANIKKKLSEREAAPAGLPTNGARSVPAYDRRYGARA